MKELSTGASNLAACFSPEGESSLTLLRPDADTFRGLVRTADALERCLKKKQFGDDVLANACLVQFMVTANRILPCRDILPSAALMPPVVSETFAYIEHHLLEDITLSGLAEQLHHNGDYISRCFKRQPASLCSSSLLQNGLPSHSAFCVREKRREKHAAFRAFVITATSPARFPCMPDALQGNTEIPTRFQSTSLPSSLSPVPSS